MSTRHLDTALAILKGGGSKRARTKGTVITLYDLGATGASVQVNHKEVFFAADMAAARADATQRKTRMEALGKTVTIVEF